MKVPCKYCGKEINRRPCRIKGHNVFCNSSEQMKYEYANGIRDKHKIVEKAHEVLRNKGHYKRDNTYLKINNPAKRLEVRKKISIALSGEKNPMYGKTPWNKMTPTKKWWEEVEFVKLRKVALLRDNYKCKECGEQDKDLYCDHIIPYRICKKHELDNLQMLCGSCHSKKTGGDVPLIKLFIPLKTPPSV